MRNGTCPKCKGRRVGILRKESNVVDLKPDISPHGHEVDRGTAEFRIVRYLCADCGFIDSFVDDVRSVPFDDFADGRWEWVSNDASPYR